MNYFSYTPCSRSLASFSGVSRTAISHLALSQVDTTSSKLPLGEKLLYTMLDSANCETAKLRISGAY